MMREAERQAEKRERAVGEGSIAERRWRENKGRLRRVEGTERERAWGRRAEEWAACGRMSTMRAVGSSSQFGRASGEMAVNKRLNDEEGEGVRDMFAMGEEGRRDGRDWLRGESGASRAVRSEPVPKREAIASAKGSGMLATRGTPGVALETAEKKSIRD